MARQPASAGSRYQVTKQETGYAPAMVAVGSRECQFRTASHSKRLHRAVPATTQQRAPGAIDDH